VKQQTLALLGVLLICGCSDSSESSNTILAEQLAVEPMTQEFKVTGVPPAGISEANTGLGLALYGVLRQTEGNLFLSPLSITSALAMTAEGAQGETADQMGRVLQLPSAYRRTGKDSALLPWEWRRWLEGLAQLNHHLRPPNAEAVDKTRQEIVTLRQQLEAAQAETIRWREERDWQAARAAEKAENEVVQTLNLALGQENPYALHLANAIWAEETFPLAQSYQQTIARFAGDEGVQAADFIHDFTAERARINDWVARQTQDRIQDIIPELPPDEARLLRLILVNAIYFKGDWSEPFAEDQTEPHDFSLSRTQKARVPMMHARRREKARYAAFQTDGSYFGTPRQILSGQTNGLYPSEGGFALLEMPYKGDRLSMVVIAPFDVEGLGAIEERLTPADLKEWIGKLEQRKVQVFLPKFRLETRYQLGPVLKTMGMPRAFTDPRLPEGADFGRMCASKDPNLQLFISQVLHKAFVEVHERGTEAAAATAVLMPRATAMPTKVPFTPTFKVDRPFLFLIRERETGALLFIGRVTDPQV